MDQRVRELVILALLSAFLCSIAWSYGHQLATALFAALTCTTGVIAVALRKIY
jgi:hypothetical protein